MRAGLSRKEAERRITAVLDSSNLSFVELVAVAELNPGRDFRYSDLSGVDFTNQDLSAFDFTGANLSNCVAPNGELARAVTTDAVGVAKRSKGASSPTPNGSRERQTASNRRITQRQLVDMVRAYQPDIDESRLNKAYVFAMQRHGNQKRVPGDTSFSFPVEVAAILASLRADETTIAAALVQSVVDAASGADAEIIDLFGDGTANLVDGVSRLKTLNKRFTDATQIDELQRLLLAVAKDVRVLMIQLADRLHRMRTLEFMDERGRKRFVQVTMDIYAPLAGRMGMWGIREELEELAFRYLSPEVHAVVADRVARLEAENQQALSDVSESLISLFDKNGIKADVYRYRRKPWSLFRKAESKGLSFEQVSDVLGFRIVVGSVEDCYRALGLVHSEWKSVPGRFKDYISTPKQNDYRSIHTTIVGPSKQRVALQIRTSDMNDIAENGIVADVIHKGQGSPFNSENGAISDGDLTSGFQQTNAYSWLQRAIEALSESYGAEEFFDQTKLGLFQDQVFCFTPRGRLITLPRGAVPIDFAYAVHTDVGNSCVGARVNGRSMPLTTELANGDDVEIIRSKSGSPPAAWEPLVRTGKARAAIRKSVRDKIREAREQVAGSLVNRQSGEQ